MLIVLNLIYDNKQKHGGYHKKFTQEDLVAAFNWQRQGAYDCCPCNFYYLKLVTKDLSIKIANNFKGGIPSLQTFIDGFNGLFPDYNFSTIYFNVTPGQREQNRQVLNKMFSGGIIDINTAVLVMGHKPAVNHCISFAYININGIPTPYVLDAQTQEAMAGDEVLDWIDKNKYFRFDILQSKPKSPFTPQLEYNMEAFQRMATAI